MHVDSSPNIILYLYNEMIGYDPNDIEAVELFKNKKMPLKVQHISLFQKDPTDIPWNG